MSQLHLLGKKVAKETVEPELASTVVDQLTDILDKTERSKPATDPDGAYWHYSVPMAGVRYYGFPEQHSS